jgi:hypothetical protein
LYAVEDEPDLSENGEVATLVGLFAAKAKSWLIFTLVAVAIVGVLAGLAESAFSASQHSQSEWGTAEASTTT